MLKFFDKTSFSAFCTYLICCNQFVVSTVIIIFLENKTKQKFKHFFSGNTKKTQSSRFKFTNIVCNVTDHKFAKLDRCALKAVARHENYLTAKVTLLQVPVTDFEVSSLESLRKL